MEYKFGALKPKTDIRDYQYEPAMISKEDKLPESFELEPPPIKNQGSVGSCVAHTAAEIEEYFNKVQNNSNTKLSVGYIYGCRYAYKGEGMYLRDALKTLKNRGICHFTEFPYNKEVPEIIELFEKQKNWETDIPNKISSYFSIGTNNREYKIKKALMEHGPIMVSIDWFFDFDVNSKGIMHSSLTGDYGGHCVLIYGWNRDGWLLQNSWGKDWGNGGRAIYPYEYPFQEVWGITDTIVNNDDIKVKNTNKISDLICIIINYIINFIKSIQKK